MTSPNSSKSTASVDMSPKAIAARLYLVSQLVRVKHKFIDRLKPVKENEMDSDGKEAKNVGF